MITRPPDKIFSLGDATIEASKRPIALQQIIDKVHHEELMKMKPGEVIAAIAGMTKMQINVLDNSDSESPTVIGALQLKESDFPKGLRNLFGLFTTLGRPLVQRIEAALGVAANPGTQTQLIDLMTEMCAIPNEMMARFSGMTIHGTPINPNVEEHALSSKMADIESRLQAFENS
jgi:hypothetical protein